MRLVAEFTTEPFVGEGAPPAHATEALRVVEASGLSCDFGPLGTSVSGEVVTRVTADTALLHGAS